MHLSSREYYEISILRKKYVGPSISAEVRSSKCSTYQESTFISWLREVSFHAGSFNLKKVWLVNGMKLPWNG